jgi:hypothetical protein
MKIIHLKLLLIPVFALLISLVLGAFAKSIQPYLSVAYTSRFEIFVVIGQVIFQLIFILKIGFDKQVSYIFNLMTVSLLGAFLLLPLLAWHCFYETDSRILLIYFFSVVLLMFLDHRRRVKKLNLSLHLSYTWVLYRCLVLFLIL